MLIPEVYHGWEQGEGQRPIIVHVAAPGIKLDCLHALNLS